MDELPMIQGWAWVAWAQENDAFSSAKRNGPGYIFQGAKQLNETHQP